MTLEGAGNVNKVLLTRPLTGDRTLSVVEGDITVEQVDAVVNAANEMLVHGGGIAGAIALQGGVSVVEESRAWVRSHGPVPTGSAAITGGGNLNARYVIHAVGPIWGGGSRNEEALLHSAVYRALALADQHGVRSIALPAISTGIFGYPKPLAIPVILQAILGYLADRPQATLSEIRICDRSTAAAVLFAEEIGSLKEEGLPTPSAESTD